MGKNYSPVTNEQRRLLVKLIYEEGFSIRQAALTSKIYYPTAKAINKIYKSENRIDKKRHRFRKIATKRVSANKKGDSDANEYTVSEGEEGNRATDQRHTTLQPIREELSFDSKVYESLDEADVDVTLERIQEARR